MVAPYRKLKYEKNQATFEINQTLNSKTCGLRQIAIAIANCYCYKKIGAFTHKMKI